MKQFPFKLGTSDKNGSAIQVVIHTKSPSHVSTVAATDIKKNNEVPASRGDTF